MKKKITNWKLTSERLDVQLKDVPLLEILFQGFICGGQCYFQEGYRKTSSIAVVIMLNYMNHSRLFVMLCFFVFCCKGDFMCDIIND